MTENLHVLVNDKDVDKSAELIIAELFHPSPTGLTTEDCRKSKHQKHI